MAKRKTRSPAPPMMMGSQLLPPKRKIAPAVDSVAQPGHPRIGMKRSSNMAAAMKKGGY